MAALRALGWRLCPLRPPDVARRMKFFARFFTRKRRLLAATCMLTTIRDPRRRWRICGFATEQGNPQMIDRPSRLVSRNAASTAIAVIASRIVASAEAVP